MLLTVLLTVLVTVLVTVLTWLAWLGVESDVSAVESCFLSSSSQHPGWFVHGHAHSHVCGEPLRMNVTCDLKCTCRFAPLWDQTWKNKPKLWCESFMVGCSVCGVSICCGGFCLIWCSTSAHRAHLC